MEVPSHILDGAIAVRAYGAMARGVLGESHGSCEAFCHVDSVGHRRDGIGCVADQEEWVAGIGDPGAFEAVVGSDGVVYAVHSADEIC